MSFSFFFSTMIFQKYFWRLATITSFPLTLIFVSTSASMAQVVYGNGPSSSSFSPTFSSPTDRFSLDTGVSCPTPSFNVTFFGGHANDDADAESIIRASSDSSANNYGGAIGFSVPIGGKLSVFCKNFAASRTAFERRRAENQLINNQVRIIETCQYLYQLRYNFNNKVFNVDEEFGALNACRSLVPLFSELEPEEESLRPSSDDIIPDKPFSPRPTITFPSE